MWGLGSCGLFEKYILDIVGRKGNGMETGFM